MSAAIIVVSLDLDDLKAACYETARMALWQRRPVAASEIQDLASEFYGVAAERAKEYHDVGEDGEVEIVLSGISLRFMLHLP